jgi:protein involved in polysaccharide export with SLBB domain
MNKIKLLLLGIAITVSFLAQAQLSSIPQNLSGYKSSDISDVQLVQIATQMKANKVDEEQLYKLLIERNMPIKEALDLKERTAKALQNIVAADARDKEEKKEKPDEPSKKSNSENRFTETDNKETEVVKNPKKIFGLEIFNNGLLVSMQNNQANIATPQNYVLGTNDELKIEIYGYQEAKYALTISPEGNINIPYVGIIEVAGLTIEQANEKIKARLIAKGYANIKNGLTKVQVAVSKLRTIKVTILGEVRKPGGYSISSLSTVFNALYLSGGPNDIGSMRLIEVVRNGKVIVLMDIYDFLIKGDSRANIILKDQDIIRIPPYKTRVSIEGEVKRTGLYEMKETESFQTLLDFSGGFADSAYTASVKAYKLTDTEKKITDINKTDFATYKPSRTESFVVRKVLNRYGNRVTVTGAVFLPGEYELTEGLTLKQLLKKANGIKEDAFTDRAVIYRYKDNLVPEIIEFNPKEVEAGTAMDIALKNNDEISISSLFELREKFQISIFGEVRKPANYDYTDNMSLKDAVLMAGGFSESASFEHIEISRRIKTSDAANTKIAEVMDITSINDLNTKGSDVKLKPWDVIIIRKNPTYKAQMSIKIEGEVLFPGFYFIENKTDRISTVLKKSGGLNKEAYAKGAYVIRVNRKPVIDQLTDARIKRVQIAVKDSTDFDSKGILRPYDQIAIQLDEIIAHPNSMEDLLLEEGDVIVIPKEKSEIRISGAVLFPTQIPFKDGQSLNYYIDQSGGFSDDSRKSKVYVMYPNGRAAKTRKFLFFRKFPKVLPGAEIVVPKKSDLKKQKLSTGEVIGISTAFASLAGVLVALINTFKK